MGMSTISTHLIIFIAVISLSTVVVAMFNEHIDSTTNSIKVQQDWISNQLKTDITIILVDYVSKDNNQTTIYLENTGATILDIDHLDIYISGERIPRSNDTRFIKILEDTEITNLGLWDPKEQVIIVIDKVLESNKTHHVIVTSQFGGRAIDQFST
jgi:archaellum component FlaF (FlaF/FlaG flagellin family)